MSFVKMPGLKGKVFVPEERQGGPRKHPCKDCYSCQHCSDDRCRVCLSPRHARCDQQLLKKDPPGLNSPII